MSCAVVATRTSTRSMLFRVSGRGRAAAPAGRQRRRRVAVARLGDAGDAAAPRRGGRLLFALGRIVLPRLRLRALLLRSRRAFARLRNYYADMMKGLIAEAAAAEPAKARKVAEARASDGTGVTLVNAGRPAGVVPAAVAGAVLRCNSHYYIR